MVVLGHSAGGALALWLASEAEAVATRKPEADDGALLQGDAEDPCMVPCLTVALAPVADLVAGHEQRLSDEGDAIELYMKGAPRDIPDAYAKASPAARLPVGVPAVVAIGADDDTVPPAMARAYCERAAAAGCEVDHLEILGADHFAVADAAHTAWHRIFDAMCKRLNAKTGSQASPALRQT